MIGRPARSTRRYDGEPPRRVIARGLVVVGMLAGLTYLAAAFYNGVPGRDYRMVDASVPRIGSLLDHDPVRLGGVRVGQVREIALGPDGSNRLKLQLEPGTRLPEDSSIRIRANGLLGARFVELVPGKSAAELPDGQPIVGDDRALTFGATDALDTFDRETRGALRPLLGELGTGLGGQGRNVNDLLRAGAQEIVPTKELFRTLNEADGALDRLLPSLRAGMVPLDDARVPLTQLFTSGDRALRPFVEERDATRASVSAAPGALDAARAGLSAGRPLLAAARSLSRQTNATLPRLPGGLRATSALLREAPGPLDRATDLLDEVPDVVPSVLRVTRATSPLLKPAGALLGDLVPVVRTLAPYGCDLENFGAVFRSMTGLGTRNTSGPNGPAMQFRLQAAAPLPTEALSLQDSTGLLVREGYPAPCKYLSKPYPIIERPAILGGGR
jgi:virulence factor Mce-like protein